MWPFETHLDGFIRLQDSPEAVIILLLVPRSLFRLPLSTSFFCSVSRCFCHPPLPGRESQKHQKRETPQIWWLSTSSEPTKVTFNPSKIVCEPVDFKGIYGLGIGCVNRQLERIPSNLGCPGHAHIHITRHILSHIYYYYFFAATHTPLFVNRIKQAQRLECVNACSKRCRCRMDKKRTSVHGKLSRKVVNVKCTWNM